MKETVKVRVIAADKDISQVTGQRMLTLKLEPCKPILLQASDVVYLFTTVPDGDNEGVKGWRQAQLRHALGLNPFYQASERLMAPEFTDVELRSILGKELLATVDVQDSKTYGTRLRVYDFYQLL